MKTVIQITDSHIYDVPGILKDGIDVRESLAAVIDDIQQHFSHVDLLIHSGDVTHDGTAAAYQYVVQQLQRLSCPIVMIPGNHDIPEQFQQAAQQFPLLNYYDLGDWQVIGIDSTLQGKEKYSGIIHQQQLDWLVQQLDNAKSTVIVVHHYPFNNASNWLRKMGIDNAEQLHEIVANHANVKAVLWGHVHHAFAKHENSVLWASAPSTCVQIGPDQDKVDLSVPPGYRVLALQQQGEITTSVRYVT